MRISDFFSNQQRKVRDEIAYLHNHPSELSLEEDFRSLYERYSLNPIVLSLDEIYAMTPRAGSTVISDGYRRRDGSPRMIRQEQTEVPLRIPIEENPDVKKILSMTASTRSSAGDPEYKYNEEESEFELLLKITDPSRAKFEQEAAISTFEKFIGWKNTEIRAGNKHVEAMIREELKKRARTLAKAVESAESVVTSIGIPIKKRTARKPKPAVANADTRNNNKKEHREMTNTEVEELSKIKVFVSHSSKDKNLVEALVRLLNSTLKLDREEIRCSSLQPYKLPFGRSISTVIKEDLSSDRVVVIGVVTEDSLASNWVLFELGAAWVKDRITIPVLGPGTDWGAVPQAIRDNLGLKYDDDEDNIVSLVEFLAKTIGCGIEIPSAILSEVRAYKTAVRAIPKPM